MDTEGIVIRNAMQEDAPFIAKCVVEAMGMPCFNPENMQEDTTVLLEVMEELCRMEESLYSWKHADMAIDAATGEPAGCLISYDGGLYAGLRQKTFSYARKRIGKRCLSPAWKPRRVSSIWIRWLYFPSTAVSESASGLCSMQSERAGKPE